jgi:hypothetical protein
MRLGCYVKISHQHLLVRLRRQLLQNLQNGTAALNKITGETAKQFFKKCCITNALDGTEDGVVWKNSDLGPSI